MGAQAVSQVREGGGCAVASPGSTIGKSEVLKCCTTGPLGTAYFSTGGGTFVTVTGGLLRRTFGRAVGGAFNKELLLVCKVDGAEAGPELAEAPVLVASSSSSITIGCCSASAIVASEEAAAPCTVRGRAHW